MNRAQSRLEIKHKQRDFVKDTGKRNAIFMIKMISESNTNADLCLYITQKYLISYGKKIYLN